MRPALAASGRHLERLLPQTVRGTLITILLAVLVPLLLSLAVVYFGRYQDRRAHELQANLEVARGSAAAFGARVQDIVNTEYAIGKVILDSRQLTTDEASSVLSGSLGQDLSVRFPARTGSPSPPDRRRR